jgi:hypothetical protein
MSSTFKKKLIIIALIVFFAWLPGPSEAATTYYVDTLNTGANDSNDGSISSPWKTIGKAATTIISGDTAIIKAGTYNENITTTHNGSPGKPITFQASGTVLTGDWSIIHDYTVVDGFTLSGHQILISSRGSSSGSYSQILNCHISNGEMAMAAKSNPTGITISGNHLTTNQSANGDWPQMQIWGSNHLVQNNEIGPCLDVDAIRFWGTGHVIKGNYIHDLTTDTSNVHSDAFQTFGDNGDACNNIVIENNRIINVMQMFNITQDSVSGIHDIIFRNNVFAHAEQNGNIGVPYVSFLNNTFYSVGLFNCPGGSAWNATGAVFKNNIFIDIHGYNPSDYTANMFMTGGYTWVREYNFFSTLAGAALTNFDNQTGGINGGSIHFVDAGHNDFSLLSDSPVIDKGATLTGFNYDILGNTRTDKWDIGAYEYAGVKSAVAAPKNLIIATPAQ